MGWPPLITARYFSSGPSDSTSRWTPCPPEYCRGIQPSSSLRPARNYPRFRIWRPSSGRQRDFNPPEQRAAPHTLWASPRPPTAQPDSHEVPVDPLPAITARASRVTPDPLCLHVLATTPAGPREPVRSYCPLRFDLPRLWGGSAP